MVSDRMAMVLALLDRPAAPERRRRRVVDRRPRGGLDRTGSRRHLRRGGHRAARHGAGLGRRGGQHRTGGPAVHPRRRARPGRRGGRGAGAGRRTWPRRRPLAGVRPGRAGAWGCVRCSRSRCGSGRSASARCSPTARTPGRWPPDQVADALALADAVTLALLHRQSREAPAPAPTRTTAGPGWARAGDLPRRGAPGHRHGQRAARGEPGRGAGRGCGPTPSGRRPCCSPTSPPTWWPAVCASTTGTCDTADSARTGFGYARRCLAGLLWRYERDP